MKRLITIALVLTLAGCAWDKPFVKPEQQMINRVEYVVRVPPADLMTLPPQVPSIDVDKAKQSDIAKWINANEGRTKSLEDKLIGVAKFLKGEQDKADDKAKAENSAQPASAPK
jgi:hypothetical protein